MEEELKRIIKLMRQAQMITLIDKFIEGASKFSLEEWQQLFADKTTFDSQKDLEPCIINFDKATLAMVEALYGASGEEAPKLPPIDWNSELGNTLKGLGG